MKLKVVLAGGLLFAVTLASAQVLNLPRRPAGVPTGSQFIRIITPMSLTERENWIYAQVISGNVPEFQRLLVPITVSATINGTGHTATYYSTPDYLAIGTDADYFLEPATPLLAQRLCNALGCSLPTRKMVDQIWTSAAVKMNPQPIPPSADMITVPVFAQENDMVRTQRSAFTNSFPLGALVAGDKKDVVVSTIIYSNLHAGVPKPVVIYGWHYTSGSPIQPLYNGHEETYADYSHGIRLVQNALTVDGGPTTISNVLANPNLAALLSDEGASEATTSDGVIRIPHYTIPALAPVITTQPRSQTVLPGASLACRVLVAGDPPLGYRWYFNGAFIPGATNVSLLLSNAQVANAGSYAVAVSNISGSVTSRPALLRVNTNVHPVRFADSFDNDTSGNWDLFWGAANGVPDYRTDWAFDYGATPSTFNGTTGLIPPAPNSPDGSTRGMRFAANNTDTNAFTAAVNIYPKGQSFGGNVALKFDLWLNYPGGTGGIGSTGSTEFAIFGIDHLGTQANWAPAAAPSSDGIWFAADGEGGTSADYRAYVGNLSGTQIDLTAAGTSGLTASNNIATIYQSLFPSSRFETAGAPGKNWIEVELRQTNSIILWLLDGTVVAERTNTSGFSSGSIMLGFMDPFASIANPAQDAFVLFDNVRVEDLSTAPLQPPVVASQPASRTVSAGSNVTFTANATGSGPLGYQWRFNGTNLAGALGTSLSLTNAQAVNAGSYDVVISNAAGLAASASATLAVSPPDVRFLSVVLLTNGQVQLFFIGVPGQDYVIQASTNLVDWRPISVLTARSGPLPFIDPAAASFSWRFYRARQATSQTLTDFEAFTSGTQVLFLPPYSSGSTAGFLNPTSNFACVTNAFPAGHSSAKVLAACWSFKAGTTDTWLRLTTFNAPNLPNPTISTNQVLQFDVYADHDLYAAIGFRETSTTASIGGDGGTAGAIEFIGGTTENTQIPVKGRYVLAGQWTTLSFVLPYEPVHGFTGNGVLQTSTGKGVLEHLELVPAAGPGTYNIYLDNFRVTDLAP